MPRRSSGGRSAGRPAPRPAAAHRPAPQPVQQAPPPAHVPSGGGGGSLLGGIGSSIAQGIGWGTGTAVAHRAVDAVMGPRSVQVEHVGSEAAAGPVPSPSVTSAADSCSVHSKAFQDCVNNFGSDISKCQFYMDMLSECKRNSGLSA